MNWLLGPQIVGVLLSTALAPTNLVEEAREIVRKNFFDPVRATRVQADEKALEPHAAIREMLASLGASHTALYVQDDWGYWAMLSIFDQALPSACKERLAQLPPRPVKLESIGAYWKQIDQSWFTLRVIPGSEAERAGLRAGDEIVSANGEPFGPITAFRGHAGGQVQLEVRTSANGPLRRIHVKPAWADVHDELLESVEKGHRLMLDHKRRVGYVPIFLWNSDVQDAVLAAIEDLNQQKADTWVIDLRDGFGGAAPEYASILFPEIAALTTIGRDGKTTVRDAQIRGPAVLLTNAGTRSGKEIVAFEAKRAKRAVILGDKTAGAVLSGGPFCLSDGSLMYLAVQDVRVDGERLEGKGVAPDIEVPWDLRYSGGVDAQLQAAIAYLSGS